MFFVSDQLGTFAIGLSSQFAVAWALGATCKAGDGGSFYITYKRIPFCNSPAISRLCVGLATLAVTFQLTRICVVAMLHEPPCPAEQW